MRNNLNQALFLLPLKPESDCRSVSILSKPLGPSGMVTRENWKLNLNFIKRKFWNDSLNLIGHTLLHPSVLALCWASEQTLNGNCLFLVLNYVAWPPISIDLQSQKYYRKDSARIVCLLNLPLIFLSLTRGNNNKLKQEKLWLDRRRNIRQIKYWVWQNWKTLWTLYSWRFLKLLVFCFVCLFNVVILDIWAKYIYIYILNERKLTS